MTNLLVLKVEGFISLLVNVFTTAEQSLKPQITGKLGSNNRVNIKTCNKVLNLEYLTLVLFVLL